MYLLVHSYLSGVAQADLDEIFTQKVAEKGKWQAWHEMEELRERIDDLSVRPDQGDCRDDLWHGVLSVRHADHIIYFRRSYGELGVDILAVGSFTDDPAFSSVQVPVSPTQLKAAEPSTFVKAAGDEVH